MIHLNPGETFYVSEKGKYRFFYPNQSKSYACDEATELEEVAHRVRCPSIFRNLKPYIVSKDFAIKYSLPYRIIWLNK